MENAVETARWAVRDRAVERGARALPEETPVAVVHDATTTAVMLATPADLADFALGFSLTEGIIARPSDARGLELVETEGGVEARLWLAADRSTALAARRRRLAGPTGCGLCGVDSLAEALRPPHMVGDADLRLDGDALAAGFAALVFIFRFRSFKEVIAAGRGARTAPAEPRARA